MLKRWNSFFHPQTSIERHNRNAKNLIKHLLKRFSEHVHPKMFVCWLEIFPFTCWNHLFHCVKSARKHFRSFLWSTSREAGWGMFPLPEKKSFESKLWKWTRFTTTKTFIKKSDNKFRNKTINSTNLSHKSVSLDGSVGWMEFEIEIKEEQQRCAMGRKKVWIGSRR